MKRILTLCFVLFTVALAKAQTSSENLTGAQILRAARAIYDQGRLHELPGVLEGAVKNSGRNSLSQSEKIEAYKLLILTYIYLEEPQKADDRMIDLLQTDHFFELSSSDPVEFKNLYKKFRVNPLFRIGAKFGVNQTLINTIENYYVPGTSGGQGEYSSNISLQFGLAFEKDFKKNFVIAPELFYTTQSFIYKNSSLFFDDVSDISAVNSHNIVQNRVRLNGLMQYKIGRSKLNPYLSAGPSLGYLLNSTFNGQSNRDSKDIKTGAAIDNSEHYKTFDISVIGSVGVRYKVGGVYVTADVRYQYGLFNVVNEKNRYKRDTPENREILYEYTYINNDFSINQAMVNVGLSYPIFSPKKLIK